MLGMPDDRNNTVLGLDDVKIEAVLFINAPLPKIVDAAVLFYIERWMPKIFEQIPELLACFLLYCRW